MKISKLISSLQKHRDTIKKELDNKELKDMAIITVFCRRLENLDAAIYTLKAEEAYQDRGLCCICGELGDGKSNGMIYCGFHECKVTV